MYDFYDNTLVIPGKALYGELEVMSEVNYKKLCRLGKIDKVRTGGGLNSIALVDFYSIPERFRVEVVRKLGYPPKKETQAQIDKSLDLTKHFTNLERSCILVLLS